MNKLVKLCCLFSIIFPLHDSYAAEENKNILDRKYGQYPRDLSGYRPSYFVIANENDNDEVHAEFSLSVKYPLSDKNKSSVFFFAYTGDYDFYLFSRDSSPVISRRQNPGVFFRYGWESDKDKTSNGFSIGWFHESNGQTIETQKEYDATENAQDYVSRGWDYLSLGLESQITGVNHGLFIDTQINIYCDCQAFGTVDEREDDIFWKEVDKQPNVNDYNGINFAMYYTTESKSRFSISFRTGNRSAEALENVSYRLDAVVKLGDVPIKFFYFNGYGINISTYHERGSYYGIGLDFW